MLELRLLLALQLRDDSFRQNLAELHAPMVETVDIPDGPRSDPADPDIHQVADVLPEEA